MTSPSVESPRLVILPVPPASSHVLVRDHARDDLDQLLRRNLQTVGFVDARIELSASSLFRRDHEHLVRNDVVQIKFTEHPSQA